MAAYAIQFRRGTTTQHSSFTGLLGEVTVDTDKKTLVVHDGSTTGGYPLAREGAASSSTTGTFSSNVTVGGTLAVTNSVTLSGGAEITGDLDMTGHIIPAANITYDLGSSTMMWRDIYVGPGSLYVNGKKVIDDDSGTIQISTTQDQNLKVATSGTGVLQIVSGNGIAIDGELNTSSGDLQIGEHVDMNSNLIKEVATPVSGTDAANKNYVDSAITTGIGAGTASISGTTLTTSGNATIGGNLTVSGTTTTINTSQINLADNILLLNSDATGNASASAGIEIERGDDLNVQLLWDETNDRWSVGAEDLYTSGAFIGDLTGDIYASNGTSRVLDNGSDGSDATFTGAVTGTVSSLSNHDTDSLTEGSSSLFFTDTRVDSRLASGSMTTLKTATFEVNGSDMNVDVDINVNSGKLTINSSDGAMTVAGATIINNTLNVGNDVTFEGDNTFNISNSSSNNVFAIDVANTTFALDLDMTVNNSATFKNDFAITNASNTSLFDVDVSTTALTIDLDTTVNNAMIVANDFTVKNSLNSNMFDIDVTNTTLDIDLDATFNNTVNVKNDFTVKNTSNTNLFDIDVSNTSLDIDLDLTVNNSATFNNDFTVNNTSNTALFDIDVSNTSLAIDLDMTVNNSAIFNNNLTINNTSNQTKVDIDVTANTYDIDMDLTVNNSSVFNNNLTINNTSSTTMVDIDVTNATFDVDMAFTVNNATTINNNFTVNNTSSTTVFDIDVSNTTLDIDLDVTINNEVTINNNLILGAGLTLSTSAEDTIKGLMSQSHASEYVVSSTDESNNSGQAVTLTAATLGFNAGGAAMFMLFLNRQLLRQDEYTVNSSTGAVTFIADLLLEDDEIEAVIYK